jgi:glutamate synthase domain-containing protein 2
MTDKAREAYRLRRKVAVLMADGRWRTPNDVALRCGTNPHSAGYAMARMVRMGLLQSEVAPVGGSPRLYRMRQEAAE